METQVMNVNLDEVLANKPTRQLQEPVAPTLGNYAVSMPVMVYSMWTVLASLQNWITTASTLAALAEAQMLATASELSAQASAEMNGKLESDNQAIQDESNQKSPDSNKLQALQTQYSTDQTLYGTPVNDYQSLTSILSQAVQTLNSDISSMVSMASQLLSSGVWIPTGQ